MSLWNHLADARYDGADFLLSMIGGGFLVLGVLIFRALVPQVAGKPIVIEEDDEGNVLRNGVVVGKAVHGTPSVQPHMYAVRTSEAKTLRQGARLNDLNPLPPSPSRPYDWSSDER